MKQILIIYCIFAWILISPFILTKFKSNPEHTIIYLIAWLLAPLTLLFVVLSATSKRTFH
jgi:hypothetical protein